MINLLSEEEKEKISQVRRNRMLLILEILSLLSLLLFFLGLISIDIYIKGEIKSQKIIIQGGKNISEESGSSKLLQEMNKNNAKIIELNSFFEKKTYVSDILNELAGDVPQGIYLTELSIHEIPGKEGKKKLVVFVSGFAKERLILFDFKKKLEKEKNFSHLSFPPSNWVNPRDVSFQFSFETKQ